MFWPFIEYEPGFFFFIILFAPLPKSYHLWFHSSTKFWTRKFFFSIKTFKLFLRTKIGSLFLFLLQLNWNYFSISILFYSHSSQQNDFYLWWKSLLFLVWFGKIYGKLYHIILKTIKWIDWKFSVNIYNCPQMYLGLIKFWLFPNTYLPEILNRFFLPLRSLWTFFFVLMENLFVQRVQLVVLVVIATHPQLFKLQLVSSGCFRLFQVIPDLSRRTL